MTWKAKYFQEVNGDAVSELTRGVLVKDVKDEGMKRNLQTGVLLLLLFLNNGFLCRNMTSLITNPYFMFIYHLLCVTDPDVVDDGCSFALCSLWVPYQVIPCAENPPAEGEVLIRSTGQTQTRVLGHSA